MLAGNPDRVSIEHVAASAGVGHHEIAYAVARINQFSTALGFRPIIETGEGELCALADGASGPALTAIAYHDEREQRR